MTDSVLNVLLGLLTSAIGAGIGWLAQSLRRRRRLERTRAFFGMPGGTECLLVVNRHVASGHSKSVSRNDVFALMELAALVRECGAQADIVPHDQVRQGLGGKAEFCIGGPSGNERTAAHLGWRLPGVAFITEPGGPYGGVLSVGALDYRFEFDDSGSGGRTYVLLARLDAGPHGRPTFLIAGQTATANHAAVRHLTSHHRELARRYGSNSTFALVLRVVNPTAYGPDVVQQVADVTREALAAREPQAPAAALPAGGRTAVPAPGETPGEAASEQPAEGRAG
ncbi:hypothetical protein P3T37_006325 [Kitasatospora sp. MAA4]|uniref:hypothetical protein n=1 Tax=Kitasatospora sp. MAA4 TaxID=3035093 RepID=UPI0024755F8B|nr:hypothetical protein [Kitasatospora sp. MAA4]MDH6136894.1 hypothetical protein [Kitasatospora sp. MAA4]